MPRRRLNSDGESDAPRKKRTRIETSSDSEQDEEPYPSEDELMSDESASQKENQAGNRSNKNQSKKVRKGVF